MSPVWPQLEGPVKGSSAARRGVAATPTSPKDRNIGEESERNREEC